MAQSGGKLRQSLIDPMFTNLTLSGYTAIVIWFDLLQSISMDYEVHSLAIRKKCGKIIKNRLFP